MSSTQSRVALIKAELMSQGLSYADLAQALDLSESSVKRMLAPGGEMPRSRVEELCRVLKLDFAERAGRLAAGGPELRELSLAQKKVVVADPKLLLIAICCLSHWTLEDVLSRHRVAGAEAVAALAQLDRLGVIELRPHNRCKLLVAQRPVMTFFRERVMADFFAGGFDGEGELLTRGLLAWVFEAFRDLERHGLGLRRS